MGTCWSGLEREEAVSRCRARKRYMKQLVKARHAFATAHALYLRSLRNTASALLEFANGEAPLHLLISPMHSPTPPPSPPPSSSSDTWTSTAVSSPLPPPPPPPPLPSHSWDFWDPFGSSASRALRTDTPKESSCELSVIVSMKDKGFVDIVREVYDYFLKAYEAGGQLSSLLEVFSGSTRHMEEGKDGRSPSPMTWDWSSKVKFLGNGGKLGGEIEFNGLSGCGGGCVPSGVSHCTTLERLYAWEKKLCHEVKGAEAMKMERERKVRQLRKLLEASSGYVKAEMKKKEVVRLESRIMVAFQAIETASDEIVKLRELELRPQLHEIVKGLVGMWKGMYECHQVQLHIVHQLKCIDINLIPSIQPTPLMHRQAALQLELEVNQWHLSFCNLMKTQQDYVLSLTSWLRLSIFEFKNNPSEHMGWHESPLYSLCEEWKLTINRLPEEVASEGIRSLLSAAQVLTSHHREELKQQKRSISAFRDVERSVEKLGSVEEKFAQLEDRRKRAVVEMLRQRADEEKTKHEKVISVGRTMTLKNFDVGLAQMFQGLTSFAGFCTHALELVHNKVRESEEEVKAILP